MANAEISSLLEERDGFVQFRGGVVLDLADIPGQDSAELQQHGWQRANFTGGFDREMQSLFSRLTFGKPLMSLQADPLFARLPQTVRDQTDKWLDNTILLGDVKGETGNGSCMLPTLLARVPGVADEIDLVICTQGTNIEDYVRENPGAAQGNERYEGPTPLTSSLEDTAMNGLYRALAEANNNLLASRIR